MNFKTPTHPKYTMKPTLICLLCFAVIPPLAAEEVPDMVAREQSIAALQNHIAQREKRLAEWAGDIVALDARIEAQVAELVKLIAGLKDSEDSRSKVNQLKRDAIASLEKGIERYATKRREVAALINRGDTSALRDLDKLDERILTRIDQIATITLSIPTHQDVAKYESAGSCYWDGYSMESQRISDEWRQNRRNRSAAKIERKHTIEMLETDLEKLDQRRRTLRESLRNRKLTAAQTELHERDLGKIDAYEDHLRRQLAEVSVASGQEGRAVGMDQAQDLIRMVEDARTDLREDVSTLFRDYDRLIKGRAYIESLRADLAARKQWMQDHVPQE